MKTLFLAAAIAISAISLGGSAARAQQHMAIGRVPLNPSMALPAPTGNPLQDQMRQDYATQLQIEQRGLLQQNPSGTTRQELAIGNALNGYVPR